MNSNLIILLYMYILEGIPYGLQSRFLPVILRSKGISLTALGIYKLLYLPWILKSFYAIIIDKYFKKRLCLFFSLCGLFIVTLFLSYTNSFGTVEKEKCMCSFLCISCCLCLYNFFAATQDIVVDGLALSVLQSDEISIGNTIQVVGYKLGALIGGGMLMWLTEFFHVRFLLLVISCIYFVGMCLCVYKRCWTLFESNDYQSRKTFNNHGEKVK